jgi:DNA-binding SARP family transcriptional activator
MEATQPWDDRPRDAAPSPSAEGTASVARAEPWVIRRKILPPALPDSVVPRRRLEILLNGLLEQHRLVCVYASAGAGKTTAILQAAGRLQRPLAWLDLDATDVATGRLLVYLEAALALHVPQVSGVATAALAAQLPHAEVAGLLAESVGDRQLLVVLDDAERLADDPEAVDVLGAFARYLPSSARLIIASRVELPFRSNVGASPWVAAVGEEDLALTVEEATAALAARGRADIDPVDAIVETGGWMTGVLFEAWRAPDHVLGLGGEADPLHGYLSTEILGQLSGADAEFLVGTSVLTEVTAARALALGQAHPSERMHSLSRHRLPVSWSLSGTVMLCHPRFREFLLKRFARRPEHEQRDVRRAHAHLLVQERHDEEAVQEYLGAGCLTEALEIIHPVLERVIERTDFGLAERWLEALAPVRGAEDVSLAGAELMLAVVREDFGAGIALADRLESIGLRHVLAGSSARAAAFMAWCYLHAGRVEDIDTVLDIAPQSPELDAVRYAMAVVRDEPVDVDRRRFLGALSGGPMDALVLRAHFDFGRLGLLTAVPQSPWAAKAAESWMVSALLTTGHTERAFELFHRLVNSSDQSVWLLGLLGPRLMLEVGDHAEAWRLLHEGRRRIQATGSVMFETYSLLIEAEFELRLRKDPSAARTVLERLAAHPVGSRYAFLVEQRDMLAGLAELCSGAAEVAATYLRRAVASMQHGERLLHLPVAAVYLAEAEWRCGHEEAADVAAEIARVAAQRQGSEHNLLSVLTEFPDVLARRIDLEPGADSEWHQLGRALLVRGVQVPEVGSATVEVVEFGRTAVTVDGAEVNPGLSKSFELLAYLANEEREEVSRQRLLDVLFEGRRDASTTAYLRQASLKLRKAVPDVLDPASRPGTLRLSGSVRVATESRRLIGLLGEATAVRGEERLRLLMAALDIADRGRYLPTVASDWAEDRRQRLEELVRSARFEAAEVARAIGQLGEARRLAEQVVTEDPYREAAWRLLMRLAAAMGDHDHVISAYRGCERALREIGAQPSSATVSLLQDFRR